MRARPTTVFWCGFVAAASVPGLCYLGLRYLYRCIDNAVRMKGEG